MSVTSISQRDEALLKANLKRSKGRELKSALSAGKPKVGSDAWSWAVREAGRAIVEDVDMIGFIRVHAFLDAIPRIGEVGVRLVLRKAASGTEPIWPLRRVRELTDRERRSIAAELERLASQGKARR